MRFFTFLLLLFISAGLKAQKIDSIYFHLYTDSLKKGVHNYINVDGKLPNGRYLPLDNTQIRFSSSTGEWQGNDLIINHAYTGDSVTVKAVLKEKPSIFKIVAIYIKKNPDNQKLKTEEEIINEGKKNGG